MVGTLVQSSNYYSLSSQKILCLYQFKIQNVKKEKDNLIELKTFNDNA